MGLETVAIVMNLEEEFEISIPDDDAEKIQTLGDTLRYIVRRLAQIHNPGYCASARTFYRLRRALIQDYGVERVEVRPDARLAELVPPGPRRKKWMNTARQLALKSRGCNPFRPFTSRFPFPQTSIRDIIRYSAPSRYYTATGAVDSAAVWEYIRKMVSDEVGVEIDALNEQTKYIGDLF
jgi:hypothetical protein